MAASAGGLAAKSVSSHWYRVAAVKPRLRGSLRVHAHRYRGQPWYVIEDGLNGRYHRFDGRAWRIMRCLNGNLTLEELWTRLAADPGIEMPTQEDILALLGRLHASDLLAPGCLPDLAESSRRQRRQARGRAWQRYGNPLSMRFHLVDPERFLVGVERALRPLLNRGGMVLWLAWVLPAAALALSHWGELTENFGERLLALGNLGFLWILFPLVKVLHEIGHGIACKRRGGEVHDLGIMLLVFVPVPYVDASSSAAFCSKHDRMLVGLAGMLAELVVAAAAFYLWLWLEPGTVRALAYDVAVLASITTVFFNANPLLRYDGYFVAADALEIPNLGQRATRFWSYVVERWVLQRRDAASPVMARGEAKWLALYAPLSAGYRLLVMFSIAYFVSRQYFVVGALIALWSCISGLALPLFRALRRFQRLMTDGGTRPDRRNLVFAAGAAAVVALFVLPLPHHTQVEGVLAWPERATLRAGHSGFVTDVAARSGTRVTEGTRILTLEDATLRTRIVQQAAHVEGMQARYDAARIVDPARAQQISSELDREAVELRSLELRADTLTVRSTGSGLLWLPDRENLPGKYLKQGEVLGYVLPDSAPRVRVIVDQGDAEFIGRQARSVAVKLPFAAESTWPARIVRAVPEASSELPSAALGREGGGTVAVDPGDRSGRKSLATHFEYELALPESFPYRIIGSRASVRFELPPEPLVHRLLRGMRILFLAYFQS